MARGGARAAALEQHGIAVTGQETFTAHCDIVTNPQELAQTDVATLLGVVELAAAVALDQPDHWATSFAYAALRHIC